MNKDDMELFKKIGKPSAVKSEQIILAKESDVNSFYPPTIIEKHSKMKKVANYAQFRISGCPYHILFGTTREFSYSSIVISQLSIKVRSILSDMIQIQKKNLKAMMEDPDNALVKDVNGNTFCYSSKYGSEFEYIINLLKVSCKSNNKAEKLTRSFMSSKEHREIDFPPSHAWSDYSSILSKLTFLSKAKLILFAYSVSGSRPETVQE